MKCPIDQTDLVRNERQGVEIDYCPTCRGVWLDRGELDKIIQASNGNGQAESGAGRRAADREWETPTVGGMHGKVRPLNDAEARQDAQALEVDEDAATQAPREVVHQHDEQRLPDDRRKRSSRRSFLEELFDF